MDIERVEKILFSWEAQSKDGRVSVSNVRKLLKFIEDSTPQPEHKSIGELRKAFYDLMPNMILPEDSKEPNAVYIERDRAWEWFISHLNDSQSECEDWGDLKEVMGDIWADGDLSDDEEIWDFITEHCVPRKPLKVTTDLPHLNSRNLLERFVEYYMLQQWNMTQGIRPSGSMNMIDFIDEFIESEK